MNKRRTILTEEESKNAEAIVAPYQERIKAVLLDAFEVDKLSEDARGVLIHSILFNMLNMIKINVSESDFTLTLSSILRAIGIENWKQLSYN